MQKISKIKLIFIIILSILILVTLGFIWGNSCMPKEASAQTSQGVYDAVKPSLDTTFGKDVITHKIFRKMAHSFEFMLLGLEVTLLFHLLFENVFKKTIYILSIGLFVGTVDEAIQILTSRGPSVLDVLIDFGGYLLAVTGVFLLILLVLFIKKQKAKKTVVDGARSSLNDDTNDNGE